MDYFGKHLLLRGAAPRVRAWKERFKDKLITRFPYALRDSGNTIDVRKSGQWVRVRWRAGERDLAVDTRYASLPLGLGLACLCGAGISALLHVFNLARPFAISWLWSLPASIIFLVAAGCLAGINEEMNIHHQVAAMARAAWEELQDPPAEVPLPPGLGGTQGPQDVQVRIEHRPGDKYPTAYVAPGLGIRESLAGGPETNTQSARFCPECGSPRRAGARFCETCGESF